MERVFDKSLSAYERLITVGTYKDAPCGCIKPTFDIARADPKYDDKLRATAIAAFRAVGGTGYGRVDLRLGWQTKKLEEPTEPQIYVLEVNANCGIATYVGSRVLSRAAYPPSCSFLTGLLCFFDSML